MWNSFRVKNKGSGKTLQQLSAEYQSQKKKSVNQHGGVLESTPLLSKINKDLRALREVINGSYISRLDEYANEIPNNIYSDTRKYWIPIAKKLAPRVLDMNNDKQRKKLMKAVNKANKVYSKKDTEPTKMKLYKAQDALEAFDKDSLSYLDKEIENHEAGWIKLVTPKIAAISTLEWRNGLDAFNRELGAMRVSGGANDFKVAILQRIGEANKMVHTIDKLKKNITEATGSNLSDEVRDVAAMLGLTGERSVLQANASSEMLKTTPTRVRRDGVRLQFVVKIKFDDSKMKEIFKWAPTNQIKFGGITIAKWLPEDGILVSNYKKIEAKK
jgi:hypothetical protein